MMDKRIRQRLLERRQELLARYHDELARATEELDSRDSEDVENATELWDARVLSVLGNTDARTLSEIVAAIRRLDDGCYGKCLECGQAIGAARLVALPEAASCFDCALAAERPQAVRLAR